MLKRKLSPSDVSDSSLFGDTLPRKLSGKRKRLFRPKHSAPQLSWTPQHERNMSELLDFVLQQEDAFKK
jgi:charged multivesicular body protein 7